MGIGNWTPGKTWEEEIERERKGRERNKEGEWERKREAWRRGRRKRRNERVREIYKDRVRVR